MSGPAEALANPKPTEGLPEAEQAKIAEEYSRAKILLPQRVDATWARAKDQTETALSALEPTVVATSKFKAAALLDDELGEKIICGAHGALPPGEQSRWLPLAAHPLCVACGSLRPR